MGKMKNTIMLVMIAIIVLVAIITGIAYYKSIPTRLFNQGVTFLDSKEYIQAKDKFNEVIKKQPNNEEAKNLIKVIDTYLNAMELDKEEKFEEALTELSSIDKLYENYSISNDIDELKKALENKINENEVEAEMLNLILSVDNKEYDKAKELINQIKTMKLSENQDEKLREIEARINKELEEIAAEEAKKVEEEKADSNLDSSQLKIANTSVAGYSNQIIGVVSDGGSYATLVRWEKSSDGTWREIDSIGARLGANGMAHPSLIYEMDKRTPTGVYSLTEAFGINSNPGAMLPYRVVTENDYWVDDPDSPYYNQWMEGPADGRWNSAEHLISEQGYYNYAVVVDYNRWPVIPGKSSAIFLHCDIGTYTYGCIAVSESRMIDILNWLNPAENPHIIIAESWDELYSY